jgi:hypothetical protein
MPLASLGLVEIQPLSECLFDDFLLLHLVMDGDKAQPSERFRPDLHRERHSDRLNLWFEDTASCGCGFGNQHRCWG